MGDNDWMKAALALAEEAAQESEIPVGAIVVQNDEIIGRGFNRPITTCDPTAHAEIQAIRDACANVNNYRLPGATLYVTLEPCSMCAGAIVHARIEKVVYGATEPKSGVTESQGRFFEQAFLNHKVEVVGGVLAEEASQQLTAFFKFRREQKKKLKRLVK
ncbi:tRNA adenosine(34) deaminase TadA [Marinomonas mediterranea]|uniref:tRNA-specific adenosine deaminase n=1 Tax=Marinomonas mediterranea (strain ATCC 700492 / JCM 21426 / NBRC 103028 / MMB-1) TaxID=717774 RepID=F2JV49_MARM1|nr:tRNA adenosine(34) deaminase TadA [Marinomonas mediterranea]ADZ92807.1 CMP/dCMP deaminase zinc-binding protein [Marinomonas mediterranea MMB-1]WCN10740.1 tRNA adenosine(34) deaminase TadA [Marinomonas mediterranea]WCN14797.1 tRNA adenosine(34) deaminase TadA [Marinomonas mediterranea]WCN18830.1 tRNA adenosine(34) deaminase TadA [Marinomonas mediterranea MMB-1]